MDDRGSVSGERLSGRFSNSSGDGHARLLSSGNRSRGMFSHGDWRAIRDDRSPWMWKTRDIPSSPRGLRRPTGGLRLPRTAGAGDPGGSTVSRPSHIPRQVLAWWRPSTTAGGQQAVFDHVEYLAHV
jgi:hypothetical protein